MKNLILLITGLLFSFTASSQILKPVKWSYAAKRTSNSEAVVYLKATIQEGWHIYSQFVEKDGPTKTRFDFAPAKGYKLVGETTEPKPIVKFEPNFNMKVGYFENAVVFQQKVRLTGKTAVVKGTLVFGVCDETQCLPPETVSFSVPVT